MALHSTNSLVNATMHNALCDARTDLSYNMAKLRELYRTNLNNPWHFDILNILGDPLPDDKKTQYIL